MTKRVLSFIVAIGAGVATIGYAADANWHAAWGWGLLTVSTLLWKWD